MTNWSDWKYDQKFEVALRSVVATNLKHQKIFGLDSRDFPDYDYYMDLMF